MSSNYYGVQKRLDVLSLIKQNVIDSASPSLTNDVKSSAEIIIKSIHSSIIQIVTKMISSEITEETFKKETDGYLATLAIYKFDELLFDKIIQNVFDIIVEDDNFDKIIKSLKNLEDNGAKTNAFCKLYSFISRIYDHLWAFECAVNILLKDQHLRPEEVEQLTELLQKIRECSSRHLQASSLLSSFQSEYEY